MRPQENEIVLADPREKLAFNGERCSPWVRAPILSEHLQRYLLALSICRDREVLDVASGEGYGSALLHNNGAKRVVGVDISDEMVRRANRIYTAEGLQFLTGDISNHLPCATHCFDLVTCFETIEHVSQPAKAVSELSRVLKADGVLLISTPDRAHPASTSSRNPHHVKEFNEVEFRSLLQTSFSHVLIYYQRFFAGSAIVDPSGKFGTDQVFWERNGFLKYLETSSLRLPRYLLAVAANSPVPPLKTGLLHDGQMVHILDDHVREHGFVR